MKCLFCPTIDMSKVSDTLFGYKCNRCGTVFVYRENKLFSWKFFKKLKNRVFAVEWNEYNDKIVISKTSPSFEVVTELEGTTNISPHNIATKLPMLIVFS